MSKQYPFTALFGGIMIAALVVFLVSLSAELIGLPYANAIGWTCGTLTFYNFMHAYVQVLRAK